MVPQAPAAETAACSSKALLYLMGFVMQGASRGNGDVPPASLAFDGGTKNSLLNKVLLGLVSRTDLLEYPFWPRLTLQPVNAPMFPYKLCLLDGKYAIVGCCGPYHVAKRFSVHALSGNRKVWWGSIPVCYAAMLAGGLAFKSFVCSDPQSDKQCAQRLCMAFVKGDFDDWGVRVHAVVCGLVQSGWASASAFSLEEQQTNLFTGYYLLLLNVMHQQQKTPGKWESKFLPAQTVKNMLSLCGHGILGNLSADAGCADFRTELPIEIAFSEVKRPFRGQPNTKDCILGTHRHHLRQLKSLKQTPSPVPAPDPARLPLSEEKSKALARVALTSACKFQSLITLGKKSAEEWSKDLASWYVEHGYKLCAAEQMPDDPGDDWDLGCEEFDADEIEDEVVKNDIENLQRVEDRADTRAEVAKDTKILESGDAIPAEIPNEDTKDRPLGNHHVPFYCMHFCVVVFVSAKILSFFSNSLYLSSGR